VVVGLLASLDASETAWDVMSGISSGSTISAAFAFFDTGDEGEAAGLVQSIMNSLNQSQVYQQWPGGIVEGLLLQSALFDSSPLRQLFESHLLHRHVSTSRQVCFGATNLASGNYVPMCNHTSPQEVVDQALASAAFPGVLETIAIGGDAYVDGGVLVNVDVITAVQQCLNRGFAQAQIIVDTVETDGLDYGPYPSDTTNLTTINVALRALALRDFEESVWHNDTHLVGSVIRCERRNSIRSSTYPSVRCSSFSGV
jgi:predicted acylesterase/phospholipase RssA